MDVGPFRFLGVYAGEPGCSRTRVVAWAVAESAAVYLGQPAEYVDPVAEWLEGFHRRSKIEPGTFGGGQPVFLDDPVWNINEPKAHGPFGCQAGCGHGRHHRVEQG